MPIRSSAKSSWHRHSGSPIATQWRRCSGNWSEPAWSGGRPDAVNVPS
jgi:hypothetical protein